MSSMLLAALIASPASPCPHRPRWRALLLAPLLLAGNGVAGGSAALQAQAAAPARGQSAFQAAFQNAFQPAGQSAEAGAAPAQPGAGADWASAAQWDRARAQWLARRPGPAAGQIARWQALFDDRDIRRPFAEYAEFLIANRGFPDETTLRTRAEQRLRNEFVSQDSLIAFFDAFPPQGNFARAHLALALAGRDRERAARLARQAWRGGEMSATAEVALFSMFGDHFTSADHDERMDALLWQRERASAERQVDRVSPASRRVFAARLAIISGGDGFTDAPEAAGDPGYLYNRSRELRQEGAGARAIRLVADAPPLSRRPLDEGAWIAELLALARAASPADAVRIAARAREAFGPDEDISQLGFRLRDDYTSLVWAGGSQALWRLGDGRKAAPLFHEYGAAAQTPQTRSKGFFWAGEAAQAAGDRAAAHQHYERAAAYPDRFYGMLALARLGRPLPDLGLMPRARPGAGARSAFLSAPLTLAVGEVARDAPWATGIRFYNTIARQAQTPEDHLLVAELARSIGRRDLAVIVAEAAAAKGHRGFTRIGHPRLDLPAGANWTMVHAIARQESQFAPNAISHAGARGLMQLMPGTAREEAGRAGLAYQSAALIDDPAYNISLGSNHIERLLRTYNGSYPLAFAAYNAGPGNVNRWLRENGDPRTGAIGWLEWIEAISFYETKNYVQRVIENAVVYEALYPEANPARAPRGVQDYLR